MKENIVYQGAKERAADDILKTTALIYFKEALVLQKYEDCRGLAQKAKEFGARQSEIRKVIVEYLNKGEAKRRGGAREIKGGRLRYY